MFSPHVQAVIDDFLPICKALAEGRYAVSIGGSLGRKTSDEMSDIDFRLFCDRVAQQPDEYQRAKEQLDAAVQRWLPVLDPAASASARQRSSVPMLTPTSRDTASTAELSGGSSRATIRSL